MSLFCNSFLDDEEQPVPDLAYLRGLESIAAISVPLPAGDPTMNATETRLRNALPLPRGQLLL